MKARRVLAAPVVLLCASLAGPQGYAQQSNVQMDRSGTVPVYRVTVVARNIHAVNYRHRSGSTRVDFRGTALMPQARGEANVESKQGRIQIDAKMENLSPATQFGPEYLTYVLWAITPEGRPKNLGEVLLNGDNSKLNVTTDLQAFGLIVTAEPYFAVTQPSDVVVMENFVRSDTQGQIQNVEAKYELLQRGQYVLNVSPAELRAFPMDRRIPLELLEARNAVRIARWTGAERFAAESFQNAVTSLQAAEAQFNGKNRGNKSIAQNAREAAQTAEDARLIAIRRMDEERIASERRASEDREAAARRAASQAEADRAAAERQKAEADRAKAEADRARAEAQAAAEREARQRAEADAARASAEAQQRAAQEQAESARKAAEQAEREKAELREQLRQQLNLILETRLTARGLIVNMSDVLFDFNKATLKPGAREKLAKIAGIALAHPGLRFSVEGHTDSIGSNEYNQTLSENRAAAVREYLTAQGLPADTITSRGFGETAPVATNATAAGRQQNRRVEIVVAGEIIGIPAQK
ncbi:MAG TPA: OmpA family protein [Candidatus Acidoferrales bacterium]|nr:OmpA family protein [Candidatus Acidoferrales bacterium]